MTKAAKRLRYKPNPHYTQEDWDEVCDNPELTDDELAGMKPASEVLPPALYEGLRRMGRPKSENPKRQVTMRLDGDVIDGLRATGSGWQVRVNDVLRRWVQRQRKAS